MKYRITQEVQGDTTRYYVEFQKRFLFLKYWAPHTKMVDCGCDIGYAIVYFDKENDVRKFIANLNIKSTVIEEGVI